ncbi:glycoside hydrolase family 3 protein [Mycena floridula]|nr:glycoside hydrolase family 3 protein [Mycena floridula]
MSWSDFPVVPDFSPAWDLAHQKARSKISDFSVEDLVALTTGVEAQGIIGRCVGNIGAQESHDFPGLCLEDGPLAVRLADYTTGFPAGINAASTFNRSLIRTRGLYLGRENKGKGVEIALGPDMNLVRAAAAGRNFETFGADPFLSGEAAYETVLGLQQGGVQACAKHFINNEQETDRTTSSSNVDDRTQHELYANPFMRSVMGGAASIMCSYNQINGTYACQNDKTLNDILKREFGFQGFVVSDWGGTHSTLSATVGLDMTMPGNTAGSSLGSYFGGNLTEYVQNGTIPRARLEDMATRILASWYLLGQDSPTYPAVNFNGNKPGDEATNEHIDVQDDHFKLVREMGAASTVLLKNIRNALPLQKPRSILLAGTDAGPGRIGPNSPRGQVNGVLAVGAGSGTATFSYLISPIEAIQQRARLDRTSVFWILDDFDISTAGSMAVGKSAALVFVNAESGEGSDRVNLTLNNAAENLILAVAAQNDNTIVTVHSVGPLIIPQWADHPNVTAILWAGMPGEEAGNSITDVLYGDWNPTGRLPYTLAKNAADYTQITPPSPPNQILQVPYTEGLLIDYRGFDARNITPAYEFGSHLIQNWENGGASPIAFGSSTALWLHRPAYQLYLRMFEGEPPSVLRGFTDVHLAPGQSKTATIFLSRHSLSIWDTVKQGWRRPEGEDRRDVRLRGSIA